MLSRLDKNILKYNVLEIIFMHDKIDYTVTTIALLILTSMILTFLVLTGKGKLQYEQKPVKPIEIVIDPDVQTITDVNTLISVGVI